MEKKIKKKGTFKTTKKYYILYLKNDEFDEDFLKSQSNTTQWSFSLL